MTDRLLQSSLRSLPLIHRGKVRDNYAVGDDRILMVATDRLSAFDVVMNEPVPGKGEILTAMALFWFDKLAHVVPNHLTGEDPCSVVAADEVAQVRGRSMLVKRLQPLPVEAVVRGYLAGSGWAEYRAGGKVCGVALPAGLKLASRLPAPIFTPATKAAVGDHDENIDFETMAATIGRELAERVRALSIRLYGEAADHARARGILIADTKFEFGMVDGRLTLCDEAFTPDSSRFWYTADWEPGSDPPALDKQFLRRYLDTLDWDKTPPAPTLPDEVVQATRARYVEAYEELTGKSFPWT